jgi:uncharacterized protein
MVGALHFFIGAIMRNPILALSCLLLAGAAIAQQTPSSPSTSPAASKAPTTSKPQASPQAQAASTAPANPLTDAQAKQMLEMTGAISLKDQLTKGMMSYIHSSMPFLPKDVSDDLDQSFQKLDLETPIIAIYKQHISAEDADAIIAFYKTPAGKNMIQAMPIILQQTQQTGVQLARKTAQEVLESHRPELQAAAKQYQEEHAPKPAPSLNTPSSGAATPNAAAPATKPGSSTAPPSTTTPGSTTPQQR